MKRQQLWLWGHKEGLQNKRWGLIGESKISPADACRYMEIENIIMVREFGKPEPPYEPYMESFRPLKNVVWSLVGAGGSFEEGELERITALKKGYPNLTGAMMDDFFIPRGGPIFSPAEVGQIRKTLNSHSLKLWTVLYSHQLDMKTEEYLKECDLITFWTWRSEDLNHLEENFKRFVLIAPNVRRMLGCYMWDYGNNRPMPLELMKRQCSLGLKWLEEGTVEGMIFLASCICDLGIETVEWTKRWIAD
jgi:hypothetical protein